MAGPTIQRQTAHSSVGPLQDVIDRDHGTLFEHFVALTATPKPCWPSRVPELVADVNSHLVAEFTLARKLAGAGLAVILDLGIGPLQLAVRELSLLPEQSPRLIPAVLRFGEQLVDHVARADHEWAVALTSVPVDQHDRFVQPYLRQRGDEPANLGGR